MRISGKRHDIERYDFERLPAGGYACKIVACEFGTSKNDGQDMIFLNVDICEGEFAGYFQKRYDRFDKWDFNARFSRKIFKPNSEDFADSFQQLLEDIEDSNAGFKFDDADINESDFVGKLCGFIFGDNEYEKKDGTTGINAKVTFSKPVNKIREGKFKIPPLQKLMTQTETTKQPTQTKNPPTQNKQSRPFDEIIDPNSGDLTDPPF